MESSDLLDLEGRVALITGSGQGIGREVALRFAEHGAGGVIVNDFFLDRAEATAREVENHGCPALPIQADVTDLAAVQSMVEAGAKRFGRIDLLVNNAGGSSGPERKTKLAGPFHTSDPDTWRIAIEVNLLGPMNCAYSVLPVMESGERGGSIITVISEAGRVGEQRLAPYSAAKAGAAGFARAIAREVARLNIRVNCVSIGTTRTPAISGYEDQLDENARKLYPLGRIGEPSDIANAVLFLASPAAAWVTGQTYPVNGGYSFNL